MKRPLEKFLVSAIQRSALGGILSLLLTASVLSQAVPYARVFPKSAEEVETALNAHAVVRASRVFARTSAITGALVFADVVLRDGCLADAASEGQILAACRASLPPHMVPAGLRFVADLPMTEGGKLARHG